MTGGHLPHPPWETLRKISVFRSPTPKSQPEQAQGVTGEQAVPKECLTLLPALQDHQQASAFWDLFHIPAFQGFPSLIPAPTWICCLCCCSSWVPREVSAGGILPSVSLSHFLTAPTRFRNSSSCSWQEDASFSLGVRRFWRVRARALPCNYPLLNVAWLCP